MRNKILIYVRLALALCMFILCGLAFGGHFYPVRIFDVQFVAALQSGLISGIGLSLVLFISVILLTLLFGRLYCSTLCPLGVYQELLGILFQPFHKKRRIGCQKHYLLSYVLAAVLFGFLLGGTVVFLRLFDPYSVAGNALSGAGYGIGFVSVLTVLVFFRGRIFCTNICPVGAMLGVVSRFSLLKIRIDDDKCKTCSLCAQACPCGSIDFRKHSVNNETCVKCFKCLQTCPHGALFYDLPRTKVQPFSLKRRQLLTTGAIVLLFGAALKNGFDFSKKVSAQVKKIILPAGAKNVQDFANRCLNCNLCVQNCPMKIIKPANEEAPFVHLDYGEAYCDFNCHQCSGVCPSGAIKHLTLQQKQNTKIATVVVHDDICIRCGLCAGACPKQIIMKEDGEVPVIRFDMCIGCGKCATVCPVKAISIEAIDEQVILNEGEK